MRYTVTWLPSAEHRLTEIWLESRQASQVTAASDWFDANLATRPLDVGESRTAGLRIAFEHPLGILFFVDEPEKQVSIFRVWSV